MGPRKTAGRLVFVVLILLAIAYLPPPEEKDWLSRHGFFFGRYLPDTLHVTYPKAILFHASCLLLAVVLCGQILKEGRLLPLMKEEALLLLFAGLCAASVLWAPWARGWSFALVPMLIACAWAILTERLTVRERCQALLFKGLFWSGIATAAFGMAAFLVLWAQDPARIHDPTFRLAVPHRNNANLAACILITPMVMAWHAAVSQSRREKGDRHLLCEAPSGPFRQKVPVPFFSAGFLTLSLLLTRSSSGLLGAVIALIVLAALASPARWQRRIIRLTLVLAAAAVLSVLVVPGLAGRGVEFCLQDTRAVRYFFWQDACAMVRQRPMLGWGLGGFFYAYPRFRQPDEFLYAQLRRIVGDHAHNEMLNVAVELGLVGCVVACAFVFLLLHRAAKCTRAGQDRPWHRALLAGTVGMLVQSCFCPSLRSWDVAPFFWTQIGLLMALARTDGFDPDHKETLITCRWPHRLGCYAILFVAMLSWMGWCYPDWRAERLFAAGFIYDVENRDDAPKAAPYLREGALLTRNAPYWFNALRRYAICLRTQGRFDDAITVLEHIDKEVPNLGTTRLYLGELYFARFLQSDSWIDHGKALSCLQSYTSANHDVEAYLKIAKVLRRGDPAPETVFAYLKLCLSLDPDNAEANALMAEVEKELRKKADDGG